jgi:hypothetical protein
MGFRSFLVIATFAILGLLGLAPSQASAAWEIYEDTYNIGQWHWSQHGNLTFADAVHDANTACIIGTPVTKIGYFDAHGNLTQVYAYSCHGGVVVPPTPTPTPTPPRPTPTPTPTPVSTHWYWQATNGRYLDTRGPFRSQLAASQDMVILTYPVNRGWRVYRYPYGL